MHDPRTDEAIDALLAGRTRRRGRRRPTPVPIEDARHPFDGLLSRLAWNEALARESARLERYGHAASVVVFEVRTHGDPATRDGWLERLAGPIARTIRRGARETDLVTRAGPGRFHVLLPETTEIEATQFAERVTTDCRVWLEAVAAPLATRAAVASATTGESRLEDALDRALSLFDSD